MLSTAAGEGSAPSVLCGVTAWLPVGERCPKQTAAASGQKAACDCKCAPRADCHWWDFTEVRSEVSLFLCCNCFVGMTVGLVNQRPNLHSPKSECPELSRRPSKSCSYTRMLFSLLFKPQHRHTFILLPHRHERSPRCCSIFMVTTCWLFGAPLSD